MHSHPIRQISYKIFVIQIYFKLKKEIESTVKFEFIQSTVFF